MRCDSAKCPTVRLRCVSWLSVVLRSCAVVAPPKRACGTCLGCRAVVRYACWPAPGDPGARVSGVIDFMTRFVSAGAFDFRLVSSASHRLVSGITSIYARALSRTYRAPQSARLISLFRFRVSIAQHASFATRNSASRTHTHHHAPITAQTCDEVVADGATGGVRVALPAHSQAHRAGCTIMSR